MEPQPYMKNHGSQGMLRAGESAGTAYPMPNDQPGNRHATNIIWTEQTVFIYGSMKM